MAPLSPSVSLPSRPRSPTHGSFPSRLRRDSRSPPPAIIAAAAASSSSRWRGDERYDERSWAGGHSYSYRDPSYGTYRPRERSPSPRRYRDHREGERYWDDERYRDGGRGAYRPRQRERDTDRRFPDRDRRFDSDISFKQRYRSPSPRRLPNRSPSPLDSTPSTTTAASHRPTPWPRQTQAQTQTKTQASGGTGSEPSPEKGSEGGREKGMRKVTPDPEIEEGELDPRSADVLIEPPALTSEKDKRVERERVPAVAARSSSTSRFPPSGPRVPPGDHREKERERAGMADRDWEREREWERERGNRGRRFESPSPVLSRGGPKRPGVYSDYEPGSGSGLNGAGSTTGGRDDWRRGGRRSGEGGINRPEHGRVGSSRRPGRSRSRSRSISRSRGSSSSRSRSRSRTSRSRSSSSTTRSDVRDRDDVAGRVAAPGHLPARIPTGPMSTNNRGRWASERARPRAASGWDRTEGDRERLLAVESERERGRVRERDRREMELMDDRRRKDQAGEGGRETEKEKGKATGQPLGGKEWAERMKLLEERKARKAEAEAATRPRGVLEPVRDDGAQERERQREIEREGATVPLVVPSIVSSTELSTVPSAASSITAPSTTPKESSRETRNTKEPEEDVWKAARARMERDGRERERLERERERVDRVLARLIDGMADRLESERTSWALHGDDDPELTKLRGTLSVLTKDGIRVGWELWQSRQELSNGEVDLAAFEDRRRLAEAWGVRRGV
ncbi:hypothetical protein [Phaffia rhodozyma]|uniref:Uncharacterized protein n=1 Tax=Phaffia rhodozyma TaxID=264483 RepID=A0A0F7SKI3_PHARH|nr:hypothetical protein [Phaffia rhodozyma]